MFLFVFTIQVTVIEGLPSGETSRANIPVYNAFSFMGFVLVTRVLIEVNTGHCLGYLVSIVLEVCIFVAGY